MAATAAVQMFMRALQASSTELAELTAQTLASNPALEEQPPLEEDADDNEPLRYDKTARHERFMETLSQQETLAAHLEEQLRRSALPPTVESAALALIPYLNRHGFFDESPERVAEELKLSPKLFAKARRAIQDLEPAGVGAADLRESLILQLQRKGENGGIPMLLLQEHWDELVRHRYADAARELEVDEEAVAIAARRIARLNPDPGSGFSLAELHVITPDVEVERIGNKLEIRLTGEGVPRLALSADYRDMMAERADNPELRRYLSRCFREGREFIRAIADRQKTILTIAQGIVDRQAAFFLQGPTHMQPLQMQQLAAELGLSTSTVSRAVRGKYLRYGRQIYELRDFFTATLGNNSSVGGIQARIRDMIATENPLNPLSDDAIRAQLEHEGVSLARRTIAKYREELKILPASLRKQR